MTTRCSQFGNGLLKVLALAAAWWGSPAHSQTCSVCLQPTRYNTSSYGFALKYGWPQFITNSPPPAILKYYLKHQIAQTYSGSYSYSCTLPAGSASCGEGSCCPYWDAGPGDGDFSQSGSPSSMLEKDDHTGNCTNSAYSGTVTITKNDHDGRSEYWVNSP